VGISGPAETKRGWNKNSPKNKIIIEIILILLILKINCERNNSKLPFLSLVTSPNLLLGRKEKLYRLIHWRV
jgi:hypothetical protein